MFTNKKPWAFLSLALLLSFPAASEGGEYLLHRIPLDGQASSNVLGDDLVLKEVTIEKGMTLWKFARLNMGKGHYYPQFLVYNDIENPNRIYENKTLLVPVGHVRDYAGKENLKGKQWTVSFADLAMLKATGKPIPEIPLKKVRDSRADVKAQPQPDMVVEKPPKSEINQDQKDFAKAKARFDAGAYRQAAALFDAFVESHPDSALKDDALFYSAESHLKLSETK